MIKYKVIIYWSDEDEAFIAEVPELPGCAADDSTYVAALANVDVIIQEWIETARELGRAIPEPKGRLNVRVTSTPNVLRPASRRRPTYQAT